MFRLLISLIYLFSFDSYILSPLYGLFLSLFMRDNDDLAGLWPGPAMARLASTLGASDVDLEAQHSAAGQVSAGGIDAAEVPLDLSLTHPSEKTSVSRAGTTNTANRLLSLPFPVQALIFAHCNHPTAISLRRTCQHFRQNFSVADTAAKTQAYRAELYARDANTYPAPCYTCLRLLPILHFDSKQPHHSRGELNSTCRLRTCIDCCLAGNRMTVGAHFWRRGVEYAKCIICGKIRPARPRVGRPVASWCGRCAEHQAIRRCIARWLKSNLFESVVCTLIECAPAFGLAVKLRETAAVGLKHDKTIYVWALYSVSPPQGRDPGRLTRCMLTDRL